MEEASSSFPMLRPLTMEIKSIPAIIVNLNIKESCIESLVSLCQFSLHFNDEMIIESVDSISRDGPDTPYIQYITNTQISQNR